MILRADTLMIYFPARRENRMGPWAWQALVAGILGGMLGWVGAHFVGSPLRRFFDLRRDIRQKMLLANGLHMPEDEKQIQEAKETFRFLGAEMAAFADGEWLANWFLRRMGYFPAHAGRAVATFAWFIGRESPRRDDATSALCRALRFAT
jgi:hypothetical protein